MIGRLGQEPGLAFEYLTHFSEASPPKASAAAFQHVLAGSWVEAKLLDLNQLFNVRFCPSLEVVQFTVFHAHLVQLQHLKSLSQ